MSMPVRGLAAAVALCALVACTPPGAVGASFGPVEDVGIGLTGAAERARRRDRR